MLISSVTRPRDVYRTLKNPPLIFFTDYGKNYFLVRNEFIAAGNKHLFGFKLDIQQIIIGKYYEFVTFE